MSRAVLARAALFFGSLTVCLPCLADSAAATVKPAAPGELLEFLADWQGSDGQWVDPMTFLSIDPARQRAAAPATRPSPAPVTASSSRASVGRQAAR